VAFLRRLQWKIKGKYTNATNKMMDTC